LSKPAKELPKGVTKVALRRERNQLEAKISPSKATLKQELKQVSAKIVPAEKKLRQQIMAIANQRSISPELRGQIFKKLGGSYHLSEIGYSDLQKILPAIQKARPERINGKVLITAKTEDNIQAVKAQFIEQGKITEQDYNAILRALKLPTDKYVNETKFITETNGKRIIKAMRRKSLMGFATVEERVKELAGALGPPAKLPPVIIGSALEKPATRRFQDRLSGVLNRTYRVERILLRLDEYTEGGLFQDTFYKPLNEATNQKLTGVYRKIEELRNLLKENQIDLGKLMTDKVEIAPGIAPTPSEKIGIYLHSLNPDNLKHLKEGNKFSDELIETVKTSLSDSEKKVAEWLHDFFQSEGAAISQTRLYVEEKPLDLVENYFPIRLEYRAEPEIDYWGQIAKTDSMDFISQWASSGIPKGFLKARTHEAVQAVDLDALGTFLNHLEMVEHYKAFAPAVGDLQLIMKNPAFKAALTNKAGISVYQVLDKWLKQVADINPLRPANQAEAILRTLRVNTVSAVLGLNITTALKQFPSFISGAAEIGIVPAIKGLFTFMASPNETRSLIKQYDIQTYRRSFEREIAEAKTMKGVRGVVGGKLSPREAFMFLTTTMDKLAVSALWRGAFDESLRKNPDDIKGAVEAASKVIRKTQPYFDVKDLPEYWRSGEFVKALTVFTNQLNQYWNYYRFDIFGKRAAGKINNLDVLKRIFWAFVVPALMIGAISRSKIQDDFKEAGEDFATMFLGTVPIVGSWITSGIKGFNDSGIISTEVFNMLQTLSYNTSQGEWDKVLKTMPEIAGYAAGLPVAQPKRTTQAIIDLASSKTDDWLELVWGKYTRQRAIVTGIEKVTEELKWDDVFTTYYSLPTDANSRYEYRKQHPQTDAALFITGKVSTLQSDTAKGYVLKLIKEYKIDTSEIAGYSKVFLGIETPKTKGITAPPSVSEGAQKYIDKYLGK